MILKRLQEVLSELFNVDEIDITTDTSFYEDLYADSLDLLEVWYVLEEEFDLSSDDQEKMKDFCTVGEVIDYISEKIN